MSRTGGADKRPGTQPMAGPGRDSEHQLCLRDERKKGPRAVRAGGIIHLREIKALAMGLDSTLSAAPVLWEEKSRPDPDVT